MAEKEVIKAPFAGLQVGKKYKYARASWPAPQAVVGKIGEPPTAGKHEQVEHTAELKELNQRAPSGDIVAVPHVQLNGKGRLYPVHELPKDGFFTALAMLIALFMLFAFAAPTPVAAQSTNSIITTNIYGQVVTSQYVNVTMPGSVTVIGTGAATLTTNLPTGATYTNANGWIDLGSRSIVSTHIVALGLGAGNTNTLSVVTQVSNDTTNAQTLATTTLTGGGVSDAGTLVTSTSVGARYCRVFTVGSTANGTGTNLNARVTLNAK